MYVYQVLSHQSTGIRAIFKLAVSKIVSSVSLLIAYSVPSVNRVISWIHISSANHTLPQLTLLHVQLKTALPVQAITIALHVCLAGIPSKESALITIYVVSRIAFSAFRQTLV